jgi:hypothetical protein
MDFFERCTRVGVECLGDLETWRAIASFAPIGTALIALSAALIALRAIQTQRDIARRRAAIDFFFKTEMDKSIVESYHSYENAMQKFKEHGSVETLYNDDADYRSIRAYLNIHELVAVGVHTGVLDETVCYEFWSDELMDAYKDGKPLIDYVRTSGCPLSYVDLERLSVKWTAQDEKDKKRLKLSHG